MKIWFKYAKINQSHNNSHGILMCLHKTPGWLSLTNAKGLRANTCNAVSSSHLALAKLLLALSICKASPALFYNTQMVVIIIIIITIIIIIIFIEKERVEYFFHERYNRQSMT